MTKEGKRMLTLVIRTHFREVDPKIIVRIVGINGNLKDVDDV